MTEVKNPNNFQTVEDEYLDAMACVVRATQAAPKNAYGKRGTPGTPVESPAYIETRHESFTSEDGDVSVATGRAFLGFIIPWLTVDDTIEVQDINGAWGEVNVISVDPVYGPDGIHHQEVWYGGRGARAART